MYNIVIIPSFPVYTSYLNNNIYITYLCNCLELLCLCTAILVFEKGISAILASRLIKPFSHHRRNVQEITGILSDKIGAQYTAGATD